MLRRVLVPALTAALVVPVAGTAAAAVEPAAPVEVTAVVQAADGRLSFVSERATSPMRGRALARRLRSQPRVVAAAVATPMRALNADPLRGHQWGLTKLAAEQVWAQGPASGQLVAVLDTGVDAAHPDLTPVVVPGADFIGTGNGTSDPHGHGTHVAGVIAAVAGNGIGGAGLAQGARVLPVRVLNHLGAGTDSTVARGIVWAVDHGASVVNLSLGGDGMSSVLGAALDYAASRSVVVVAASGNEGDNGDPILYPAATPGVVAVAATGSDDTRPSWSSSGPHIAVAAPGVGIVSAVPGGGHQSWSGTSMAAPFVAAAAALLKAQEPSLTPGGVRQRLMSTARDVGAAGFDPHTGAGRIDVVAARAAGLPAPQPVQPVVSEPVVAEVVAPAPAPVTQPAPAPVTQPAPAPVTEPAPAPVTEPAPAPVTEPAPAPVTEPAPAPVTEPAPVTPEPVTAPAPVETTPVAAPSAAPPAPKPAPTADAIRTSRSAAVVLPRRPVVLAARVLSGSANLAAQPVVLERRVGTGAWTPIRSGTTSVHGLVSWTLLPDLSGAHRFRAGSIVSAPVQVDVRQVVTTATRRSGRTAVVDVRVVPGGATRVVLQVLRSTGWAGVTSATTTASGTARFVRALPVGSRVRVVAPARTSLLAGTSVTRAV